MHTSSAPEKQDETRGQVIRSGSVKAGLLVVIAVLVVVALIALPVKDHLIAFLKWTEGLGAWGPVFVAAFYVVATILFLPGSVLTLGAGFLFGVGTGFATVWIGATLGACAAFLVGRFIARNWVAGKVAGNAGFAAMDEAVGREGFKIVFLLRLSPIFPFNFLNYALGLTRVPFRSYALASLIGMIPGELMYVYLGSAARSLAEVAAGQVESGLAGRVFFWFGLVVTILAAGVVTRIARRSLKEAEDLTPTAPSRAAVEEPPTVDDKPTVRPEDAANQELLSNAHPPGWLNPEPADRYNLVVIGAGTAGLVAAAAAAGLGARVALVEKHLMGGDCLNYGCVPSKSLIRSSRIMGEIARAGSYGIIIPDGAGADFPAVMERMRRIRARISQHDSAERFKGLGVDVFLGHGRFTGRDTIDVAGKALRFGKAVIATGARAAHPEIKGMADAGFLTNETVFSLTELPERLAVIGGGPIGCELAQAFKRLGSRVILFHKNDHILDREDPEAAGILQKRFNDEGIRLILNSDIRAVENRNAEKVIHYEVNGVKDSVAVKEILVGVGRKPNVEYLGLESAGVAYDSRVGVVVDDTLRTANPNIYAAGDVCMSYKFTHAADAAARIVVQNALFKGSKKVSALTVPWCTYTDPEIAHVGFYQRDADKKGVELDTYFRPLGEVDRAVADGEEEGFVKIHVKKGSDEILGATIVAAHAGEMINVITMAMTGKIGLGKLASVIHPYPTQAEAVRQLGDAYNRTRLTPFAKRLFIRWFKWTR